MEMSVSNFNNAQSDQHSRVQYLFNLEPDHIRKTTITGPGFSYSVTTAHSSSRHRITTITRDGITIGEIQWASTHLSPKSYTSDTKVRIGGDASEQGWVPLKSVLWYSESGPIKEANL